MDAVILCGGRGKRLGKITDYIAKPLVRINSIPLLSYILSQLHKANFKKVFICVGYKSYQFEHYINEVKYKNMKIILSKGHWRWETGKRIYQLKNRLSNKFMVLYGDNFVDFKNFDYLKKGKNYKSSYTLLIQNKLYSDDGEGNVKINEGNNSIYYSHKRRKDFNYVELGYMILNKECFKYFKKDENESLTTILSKLSLAEKINYVITEDKYITATNKKKLKEAVNYLQ